MRARPPALLLAIRRGPKFDRPVLGRVCCARAPLRRWFARLPVGSRAGLEAPSPARWRGEAVKLPANRTPPPAEMEHDTPVTSDNGAQVAFGELQELSVSPFCAAAPAHLHCTPALPIPSRVLPTGKPVPPAARAPEPRLCRLRAPSVRSSLTERPLAACPRLRCALACSLRWHSTLWFRLWLGLLLPLP